MQAIALLVVIVGSSVAAPAKLDGLQHHHHHHPHPNDPLTDLFARGTNLGGYNYEPPEAPSGLYELPSDTTTTTRPHPPPDDSYLPPPPDDSYLPPPPDEQPQENVNVPQIVPPGMLMPYKFDWEVRDPDSGNSFSHVENSDGKDVTGEYSVLLPDNRLQIVRFKADPVNGYQAEVSYEPAK